MHSFTLPIMDYLELGYISKNLNLSPIENPDNSNKNTIALSPNTMFN